MNPQEEELMTDYLLGRLSEDERSAVADRLFTDEQFAESVEALERDLLDRFARGELSKRDHESVEANLLASDRQRTKLQFASAIARRRSRFHIWVAIAAAILLAAVGTTLFHPPSKPPVNNNARATAAPVVFAALLSPGGTRDGAKQEVRVPQDIDAIRLDLEVDSPMTSPYATLFRDGLPVFQSTDLSQRTEAGRPILSVKLSPATLTPGSYRLAVQKADRQLVYNFNVH